MKPAAPIRLMMLVVPLEPPVATRFALLPATRGVNAPNVVLKVPLPALSDWRVTSEPASVSEPSDWLSPAPLSCSLSVPPLTTVAPVYVLT